MTLSESIWDRLVAVQALHEISCSYLLTLSEPMLCLILDAIGDVQRYIANAVNDV